MSTADLVRLNDTPSGFDAARDLPAGFAAFHAKLHAEFTPRQQVLAEARAECKRADVALSESGIKLQTVTSAAEWTLTQLDEAVELLRRFDNLSCHPFFEHLPDMPGLEKNYDATRAFLARIDGSV